eukprot:74891-Chlamydomonas_euryale.AAC.6
MRGCSQGRLSEPTPDACRGVDLHPIAISIHRYARRAATPVQAEHGCACCRAGTSTSVCQLMNASRLHQAVEACDLLARLCHDRHGTADLPGRQHTCTSSCIRMRIRQGRCLISDGESLFLTWRPTIHRWCIPVGDQGLGPGGGNVSRLTVLPGLGKSTSAD